MTIWVNKYFLFGNIFLKAESLSGELFGNATIVAGINLFYTCNICFREKNCVLQSKTNSK